jgi:hypothetical protein
MLILVIIGYSFIAAFDLIPLYKKKYWRDFWVCMSLWTFGFLLALLLCANVKIPSPEKPVREFITSIFGK